MTHETRLATLGRATALLQQARQESDPFKAKEVRDIAAAAAAYAKQKRLGKEAVSNAHALELDADRVLYQITKDAPKNKGAAATRGESCPASLAELGIDKHDAKEIRAVGKLSEEQFRDVRDAGKSPTHVVRAAREARAKSDLERPVAVAVEGLIRGDFRELARQIPDESAQLVFTDPPYDRDSLPLYEAAAQEAARILRPGGSMICYVGQVLLPDVLPSMAKHLRYWWTAACVHDGAHNLMQKLGIRCGWKPLLWFVKGTRGDVQAVIRDTVSGGSEKDSHEWQQAEAEAAHFIAGLTAPDGLVVDFFAGGGTTCVVAERLGRRWMAFEVNARHYESAAKRITARREAA